MPGLTARMKVKKGRKLVGWDSAPVITIDAFSATANTGVPEAGYSATATDAEDGDISANVTWTSNHDGVLDIGAGPLSLTFTTVDTHILTALIVDAWGNASTATETVVVSA